MTDNERLNCDWRDIESLTQDICSQIEDEDWRPDLIVAPSRGGLLPGTMISHYFDIPFYALNWSTRDHTRQVSEASLAEEISEGLSVLIVDDICDSGETLGGILDDWESNLYNHNLDLGGSVRIATLHYRRNGDFEVDYIGNYVDDEWVVYPIEAWWK